MRVEHAPRADAVAHHAGRNFEETVGEREHARHPSPPDGVDPQVLLHARSGHRDADPIEIGDGKQQDEQTDDAATVARCTGHEGGLCHGRGVTPGRIRSAATAATVLSTSRWNASIVTSRSASGVSSSLQCDRPLVERGEHHHRGHDAAHLDGVVQRPRWQTRRVAGRLLHRLGAQIDEPRIEPAGIDAPHVPPLHADAVGRGGARRRVARVGQGLPQRVGFERPLIEGDLAHAGHGGHDRRLHRHGADGAHHAGVGSRVAPGDLAAGERRLGGGEERIAAHRDRRRARVRGLADEAQDVALDTVGADDRAGRSAHRLEHRPLLDVQLEVGARAAAGRATDAPRACGPDRRRSRPARPRSRTPWRSTRPRTLSGTRLPLAPDDPSRLREKRAPSSSAKSTTASVTGGVVPLRRRSASTPARTPSGPSSQPPLGTESRWPPMTTVSGRAPAA